MECVIKIVKGPGEGEEFRTVGGETVVGRGPRAQVRLNSASVSYEHAVISRSGDDFFVENLSASGTLLNDERVTGKVRLRVKDRLRLGDETVVRIEALPEGAGGGSRKRLLLFGVIAMLVVLMVVVIADPLGEGNAGSTRAAYAKIDAWAQQEAAGGRLPNDVVPLLENAWRLERAGDRGASVQQWVRLSVLLDAQESTLAIREADAQHRHALARLMQPDPKQEPPTNDEMEAALLQFVRRMIDRK